MNALQFWLAYITKDKAELVRAAAERAGISMEKEEVSQRMQLLLLRRGFEMGPF